MNQNEYNGHIATNPLWVRQNALDIPLDRIKESEEEGQVRQAGIINSHVDDLEASIGRLGQMVPITVEEADEEGYYVPADGNHRLKALQRLKDKHKDNPKYRTVRVHVRNFDSAAERIKWQMRANDPLPVRASSLSDWEFNVGRLMNCSSEGVPKELQGGSGNEMYLADPEKYQEVLKGYLKRSTSLTASDRTKVARQLMKGFPNQKLKNYDSRELKKKFSGANSVGWKIPSGNGSTFNGWRVMTLGEKSHVFPNITGNSFKAKTDNDKIQTAVVIWDSNPFGKTGTRLDEVRRKMIADINIANTSSLLRDGRRLVDKVFIAPQKIGAEVQEEGFYELSLSEKGTFSNDAFPNDGWTA